MHLCSCPSGLFESTNFLAQAGSSNRLQDREFSINTTLAAAILSLGGSTLVFDDIMAGYNTAACLLFFIYYAGTSDKDQ